MLTEPPFILFAIVITRAWSRCSRMRLAFPSGSSGQTVIRRPRIMTGIKVYHHACNVSREQVFGLADGCWSSAGIDNTGGIIA